MMTGQRAGRPIVSARRLAVLVVAVTALVAGIAAPSSGTEPAAGSVVDSAGDAGLAEWPDDYQDWIGSVGGSKFIEVDGVRMHYIDTDPDNRRKPTILLVHGIPTHTYLWRDVVPELRDDARVIAVDLVGYGRSDRPRLGEFGYTPPEHARYLSRFVDELGLRKVNLILHDLGGPAGLGFAMESPGRVGSITLVETLWTTVPGIEQIPEPFGPVLQQLREPGVGEELVRDQNVFVNGIGSFTATGISDTEQEVYSFPWADPDERLIQLPSGPLAFPIADESPVATAYLDAIDRFLRRSRVPKLVVDTTPGLLSQILVEDDDGELVRTPIYAEQTFRNTSLVTLDGVGHYLQEDRPAELGDLIAEFVGGNRRHR